MIVLINADHTVVLNSAEDTKALKIVTSGHMSLRQLTDALRGIADVSSLQYAWIDCKWLRENSGLLKNDDWVCAFEEMREFARSKGWVRDRDEAIRAHIEQVPAP